MLAPSAWCRETFSLPRGSRRQAAALFGGEVGEDGWFGESFRGARILRNMVSDEPAMTLDGVQRSRSAN